MEIDNFLTLPRWKILEIISDKPSSPLQISNKLGTSVAYVSQQLKLLEAVNLVKKDRTGSVKVGEPRTLFSIAKDILHLTILTQNFSTKKLITLDEKSKILLRIWLIDNPELRYSLERFYWLLENDLSYVKGIFLQIRTGKKPLLLIITDSEKLKIKSSGAYKEIENAFELSLAKEIDPKRISEFITLFHDPILVNFGKKMKGGYEQDV